jgi:hypothetical protein
MFPGMEIGVLFSLNVRPTIASVLPKACSGKAVAMRMRAVSPWFV